MTNQDRISMGATDQRDGYEDFVRAKVCETVARGSTRRCRYPTRSSRTSAPSWSGRAARALPRCSRPSGSESRASNWRLRARSARTRADGS